MIYSIYQNPTNNSVDKSHMNSIHVVKCNEALYHSFIWISLLTKTTTLFNSDTNVKTTNRRNNPIFVASGISLKHMLICILVYASCNNRTDVFVLYGMELFIILTV